ncbi:MAG TPA: autoinducer-2 kinase [Candidatus Limnocylindria bacterium]|nr:autoinducer-2 kinase [Candidatus Limnocylindria bacterium]
MAHLLALDLGTGSCRAVIFDADGRQVAVGQREWAHPSLPDVPGSQVFDTEHNWQLIGACARDALAASGLEPRDIDAVSATSMREGMVLYDEHGREIWACPNVDSRAADEAAELVRSGAARTLFETGGDWVPITAPARFRWIQRHQPDVFAAAAHLGMLSDWALYRLTGRFVTDPSAGSSSDLFDLRSRTWSTELLGLVGVDPAIVPEVLEPGTVIGVVNAQAAAETGLAEGTPVVVGGADTQLGLVGIGVSAPGRLTLVGGSFWQLTAVTDAPLIDPEARVRTLCHAVPGAWMTEGIGFYCGIAMRWFRDAFCEPEVSEAERRGVDPYVVMEAAAESVPPGAHGVLAIFSNVMDVKRWVQATPSFLQFDVDQPLASNRAACIRALEEQAAFASRGHLEILRELTGSSVDEILMTGGAAKGSLWPQIVADVLGVRVTIPEVKESTALGAAMFAGIGVGVYPDLPTAAQRLVRLERSVDPNPEATAAYDAHYARWREAYARVLELSESGLLRPMWWPAGANAVEPA